MLPRTAALALLLLLAPASGTAHAALAELRDPSVVGMDPAALRRIDSLIEAAIAAKVTPGAALAIGRHGQVVRLRGYGRVDWKSGAPRVTDRTIYDLASLTKPVATTTAAMLLVQDGILDLDRPLAAYLPEWRGLEDRARVTARHLLAHTSGLPAGGPLRAAGSDRRRIIEAMAAVPLTAPPGRRAEYSDYGMILLGALVERLAGQRLDALLESRLFEPLGMEDTGFNPLEWGISPFRFAATAPTLLTRIAPTENTTSRGHIRGVVHDPIAFRMGGVTGHAGLFGSARDMALYAEFLLRDGQFGDGHLLQPDLVRSFTGRAAAESRFALGWELARPANSSGGHFPPTAFGHTGFTGTSMWLDRERGLYVVLLTNRLNPNSREQRHVKLRRDVHEALSRAITG
jgi:CubicO group peptidase (beta-lactamase class C family)